MHSQGLQKREEQTGCLFPDLHGSDLHSILHCVPVVGPLCKDLIPFSHSTVHVLLQVGINVEENLWFAAVFYKAHR